MDLLKAGEQLKSMEFLGRVGAGLAHETKNPLCVIRGFAKLITRGELSKEEIKEASLQILEETDRTVARLDEFLLLSRPARLMTRTRRCPML